MKDKVAVIGDGAWGTALAMLLSREGHPVSVWGPFPEYIQTVRETAMNPSYLPDVPLPPAIAWTADCAEAVDAARFVVLATPSRFCRDVLMRFADLIPEDAPVVSVAKGFDPSSHHRISDVASEILGRSHIAVLSGPSHAEEVARGIPTAVVVASASTTEAVALQELFSAPRFRVYTAEDIIGVELGGALKNVIAVAVGVSDGIGFGDNTRAALITRGLAEMTRLGSALGATAATFAGLSGMGDLIVTCASRLSRNHTVGERLGRGEKIDDILGGMKQVAEGVWNCEIARALAQEVGCPAPITEEVYRLVHCGKEPHAAVESLLSREAKPETH